MGPLLDHTCADFRAIFVPSSSRLIPGGYHICSFSVQHAGYTPALNFAFICRFQRKHIISNSSTTRGNWPLESALPLCGFLIIFDYSGNTRDRNEFSTPWRFPTTLPLVGSTCYISWSPYLLAHFMSLAASIADSVDSICRSFCSLN